MFSLDEGWLRIAGFVLLAAVLLAGYVWVIGVDALRQALASVGPRRLVSLALVGVVPMVVWGVGFHLVLDRLGRARGPVRSVLLFDAAGFLNSVTPFGQLGGDPPAALLFTRALDTDFETGLAAIGTTNAVNRLASLFLGLLGVSYLGSRLAVGRTLEMAAVVVVATTVVVLLAAGLAWRVRRRLVRRASGLLARGLAPLGRLPRVTAPSEARLRERATRFVTAIEAVASAPRRLALVFGLGLAGQLAVAATLWVALAAVDVEAAFAVVVLVIPVARLSGAAPTPGGLGGAEVLLTGLLVATTGATAATAGAAALLYRAGAFWLPSLGGGVVTAWYVTREPGAGSDRSVAGPRQPAGSEPGGILLLAVTAALVALVAVIVHRRRLLVEPDSAVVHVTRDAALVVVSFALAWVGLRTIPARLGL